MAARTRFFRARWLISSPSKKSIARHALPARPALKSLSGSGRLAPWAKVSFTLSLWALATAIIPSRDHTGLPLHFHSSTISRSASRMLLRMLANVVPRQSVSFAMSSSIRSDGFMGSLCLEFLSRFSCEYIYWVRSPRTSMLPNGKPMRASSLDSRLLSRPRRPVGRFNTELLGVLRVQPLPAAEFHRLHTNHAVDGGSAEMAIQDIETNVPP